MATHNLVDERRTRNPEQIKNPVEWGAQRLVSMTHRVGDTARAMHLPDELDAPLPVNRIGTADIRTALTRGLDDFGTFRSDVISLAIIYPVAGLVLAYVASTSNLLPLIFPLAAGFALVGPIAGLGFYGLSRRREREAAGQTRADPPAAWGGIALVGLALFALLLAWLIAAWVIYAITIGTEGPHTTASFLADVFTTGPGWAMILIGNTVGLLFACAALAIGAISFPLMLDRPVGPGTAMRTSIRAAADNPGPMAIWGLIVAAGLVIGSLPALLGLVLVVPILGHATWHLYRALVPKAD